MRLSQKIWGLAVGLIGLATAAVASDRMMLWKVVQTCIADHRLFGASFPCLEVNMPAGYAVLQAPLEATHIIVTPIVPVDGIESPALGVPGGPNYMDDAWASRHYVEDRAHRRLAWDEIGLAVNSRRGRSQDQLHIHIDCVKSSVRVFLRESAGLMSADKWVHLKQPIEGTRYWALLLNHDDLEGINVIQLARSGLQIRPDQWPNLTVALIGAVMPEGRHGFYLLADLDYAGLPRPAHAEYLLDHSCGPAAG